MDSALHLHLAKVLSVEFDPDLISARTKVALAKRKSEGMKLGWPVGPSKNLRLDPLADKIDSYLAKKIDLPPPGQCASGLSICHGLGEFDDSGNDLPPLAVPLN